MNPIPDPQTHSSPGPAISNRSIWQRIGGSSLSISLILHVVLLAIGVIWVFQIIPQGENKVVDFLGKSGGGGSPASETKVRQRVQMVQPDLSRIVAMGATGIPLPEPVELTRITSVGGISSGGLPAGMGGPGNGGGNGDGDGRGIGNGLAPGMSNGNGTNNPFGMPDLASGGLEGSFYDLKQDKNLKPTEITNSGVEEVLKEITRRGIKDRDFAKYFKAPGKLYQTKFQIPLMSADLAPAAFEVEKHVQPKRWVVVYRGAVKAPESGKFRFVGAGDDVLVVRFNNHLVFDHGYTLACSGGRGGMMSEANYSKDRGSDTIKNFKRTSPMPVPTMTYKYSTTNRLNQDVGGLAVGPEFQVSAGATYPIEILIGEIPGGLFSTALLIQKEGVIYEKDPAGYPILPLFRLDHSLPDPNLKGEAPPFDPNGPIWKAVEGGPKADI